MMPLVYQINRIWKANERLRVYVSKMRALTGAFIFLLVLTDIIAVR